MFFLYLPSFINSSNKPGHSDLKTSAPVNEPSPPQTIKASIPFLIKLYAALNLPLRSRKDLQRAVPISVPP
jgi:hypothetical protein